MDPITVAAALVAVVTGASEALGGQLLAGLISLLHRPFRDKTGEASAVAMPPGQLELKALQESPQDQQKAVALAEVLLARAQADSEFERAFEQWWTLAAPVRASIGNVVNEISGGTQQGPVLQGRDFTDLKFGVSPPSPPHDSNSAR